MRVILEFVSIIFVSVIPQLASGFVAASRPDSIRSSTPLEILIRYWTGSVSAIVVVLLVAVGQPNGTASVGIVTPSTPLAASNANAILVGIISVVLMILATYVAHGLSRLLGRSVPDEPFNVSNPWVVMLLRYQEFWGRFAHVTVVPLTVIAEEMVYRGYLVLFLGSQTRAFIPWIILSIALSVLVHLYQGRNAKSLALHALYAALFIALVLLTNNILTPIVAHVYFNMISASQTWRRAEELGVQPGSAVPGDRMKLIYAGIVSLNILSLYGLLRLVVYGW